ncbi:hypothetical protein FisN_5Hh478 [Fistulifera solaris]|uniref:NAD(P)-binding domain-containing protein n=1 Tax=Fistulifera solaris TaxID=1519565 RepID=A0A1Z5JTB4_FISSO|nr:hypothetical protein FisN_5Hh478 [Fistulifera solaris]|eukprot:GAX17092.1 hypothetical protein FisN_5Hh478 [Fistulifera solaris]
MKLCLSSLLLLAPLVTGYTVRPVTSSRNTRALFSHEPAARAFEPFMQADASSDAISRRDLFSQAIVGVTASMMFSQVANAAEGGIGSSPDSPIVVLGAGGKVGKLCTEILANKGLYVRATTRSGRSILEKESPFVSYAQADVTQLESLENSVKGASGVIFAASASGKKKGGEPVAVDYLGVYNAAKACLDQKVSKLVVVSAATATRPDSLGFKATNYFVKFVYGDRIMDSKIAGEAAMRDLYASAGSKGYAVVRPGGLNDKKSVGSAKVHVSQGDVYASEISREDVALVTVATLLKGAATDGVTFELNQEEGLAKALKDLPDPPAELVHAGAPSFDALLDGLLTDEQIKKKYSSLINDFRGDGMPSLEELLA